MGARYLSSIAAEAKLAPSITIVLQWQPLFATSKDSIFMYIYFKEKKISSEKL